MGRLNDLNLATQVAVFHNKRAFDQLVRKYQSPVRRFFLNLTTGDGALSDDLAQDTFIKAYTHISQFRGTSSFLTWLTRIAYNVWYDHCRKIKNEESCLSPQLTSTSTSTSHSSIKMDIYEALRILKEEERTCITLQMIDGYPIDEIASMTGIPANTVKSHLKRGKEKLVDYLKKNGYDR
jgi:RNA polymerase sigma-70 factor (ECF subfamily)